MRRSIFSDSDSEELSDADSDAKMMQELFGSDSEEEVTEVTAGFKDDSSDPLIVEATEPQVPDPEIYGGELVLDDPPPSRSNDEDGAPNHEDAAPKQYGCSKCRWRRGGCSQCHHWADLNSHGYVRDNWGNPMRTSYQP